VGSEKGTHYKQWTAQCAQFEMHSDAIMPHLPAARSSIADLHLLHQLPVVKPTAKRAQNTI
jgi:hypothetical protein